MNSITFQIDTNSQYYLEKQLSPNLFECELIIPILPAFSVEYFRTQVGALAVLQGPNDRIQSDRVIIESEYSLTAFDVMIELYHHGIRDYSALFPWIANVPLRDRIGQFVRGHRNLVHSNFYTSPYISRADAMDIRIILDKTIKEF